MGDLRKIYNKILEPLIVMLHQYESEPPDYSKMTAMDVVEHQEGGRKRYLNDNLYHLKVDKLAGIIMHNISDELQQLTDENSKLENALIDLGVINSKLTDEVKELRSGKYKDGLACFKENQQLTDENKELREAAEKVYSWHGSRFLSDVMCNKLFSNDLKRLGHALAKQGDSDE